MLIGMELVRELVETVILTGRLKDHDPVSLLLIASPESGKTSIVLEKECVGVIALTDVTGKGLQTLCQMKPDICHVVINDMVAINAHKPSVSRYTISMLNAMTEEGIQATAFPGTVETFRHGKRGVIASLPSGMAHDGRNWWVKTGFSSRMLPFFYKHSTDLNIRIKTMITRNRLADKKPTEIFPIPNQALYVVIPDNQAQRIQRMTESLGSRFREEGYRRLKQFRALASAHALLRTWKAPRVIEADVIFLEEILPYISYSRPKEIG